MAKALEYKGIEVGSVITIYEDPYTRQKEEGKAEIVEVVSEQAHEIHLKVRFLDEPETIYFRIFAKACL